MTRAGRGVSSRVSTIARNALSNYAQTAVSLAVLFWLTPAIIRSVGRDDFGLWVLASAVVGVLELLDAGLLTGVVKWVAESKGSGDLERRNRMLSTVQLAYLGLSLAALAGVIALSFVYLPLFDVPAEQQQKALMVLWILAARIVFVGLPLRLFMGVLFGEQRIAVINAVKVPSTLLYGLGGWGALHQGWGVVGLAWVSLGVAVLEHLAYVPLAFAYVPGLRVSWALVDRSLRKEAFSVSSSQWMINVSSLLVLRADLLLVKFFLPLSAVAVYAIALNLAGVAFTLIKQFVNVLSPLIAELGGEGRQQQLRALLLSAAKLVSAAAVVVAVTTYVFAREAITFWVGPELAEAAPVLIVLITAFLVSVPSMIAADVLFYTGHHRIAARAALLSIGINLTASVALVGVLGFLGVALGTLLATAVADFGVVVGRACRNYGVGYWDYARRVLLPAGLPGVLQWCVISVFKVVLPPSGLLVVGMEALAGVVAYGAVFWLCCIEEAEKDVFLSLRGVLGGRAR